MEILQDGKGRGYTARICNENMIATQSVISSVEMHHNIVYGSAYNIIFDVSPSASSPILYIKNEDDRDMVLEGLNIRCSTDNIITIRHSNTGTLSNGTVLTPVSLNIGSRRTALGIFKSCNKLEALSVGTILFKYYIPGNYQTQNINFDEDIILPKNRVLTLWAENIGDVDGFLPVYWDYLERT